MKNLKNKLYDDSFNNVSDHASEQVAGIVFGRVEFQVDTEIDWKVLFYIIEAFDEES